MQLCNVFGKFYVRQPSLQTSQFVAQSKTESFYQIIAEYLINFLTHPPLIQPFHYNFMTRNTRLCNKAIFPPSHFVFERPTGNYLKTPFHSIAVSRCCHFPDQHVFLLQGQLYLFISCSVCKSLMLTGGSCLTSLD